MRCCWAATAEMRFHNRTYRSLPPRPLDHRIFLLSSSCLTTPHKRVGLRRTPRRFRWRLPPLPRWGRRRHSVRGIKIACSELGSKQWLIGAHRALSCGHSSPVWLDLKGGTLCRLRATGNSPRWGLEPRAWRPPRRRPRPAHKRSVGRLTARWPAFRPFL